MVWIFFWALWTGEAPAEVSVRVLPAAVSQKICSTEVNPEDLWQTGIYDANIEAGFFDMSAPLQGRAPEKILSRVMKAELAKKHAGSGAWGTCEKNQKHWFAAFKAQDELHLDAANKRISFSVRPTTCEEIEVYWAKPLDGPAQKIFSVKNPVSSVTASDVDVASPGLLSVYCLQLSDKHAQPLSSLWYIAPVGGTSWKDVAQKVFYSRGSRTLAFAEWINGVRLTHQLPPFKLDQDLNAVAKRLASSKKVPHDLWQMQQEAQRMHHEGMELVGEDRVMGKDLSELATSLWLSGRHRNLLLTEDAKYLGLDISVVDGELFAVLVTGNSLQTAMGSGAGALPNNL